MTLLLPSSLGRIAIPSWQFPGHIRALQRAVIRLLYDPTFNRLIVEIPVRHGKSFYCSYILPAWFMITHPDLMVMIISYGSDFAVEWSSKVRDLVGIWGPKLTGVRLDPNFKTMSHFRLAYPHTGELRGLGIGAALAGKGGHLIICDDLVKEFGEVATEEMREKLYRQFHGELLTRLEPGGKIIMVMSRRHPDDLSGKLLESNEHLAEDQKWRRITFPALDENDQALWPERYPAEQLKAIRHDHELAGTEWIFHSLYQQDPATAAELCEWPASYWKDIYYHEKPTFTPRFKLMSLDPSKGKRETKGSYSALLYGELDSAGTLWIEDPVLRRVPVPHLEALAVAMFEERRPDAFAIETNLFQEVVATNILAATRGQAPIYPYESIEHKEVRIRMLLSPWLAQGRIKIKDTPQGRILGQQLRDFPLASHDDGPDSLALMVRLLRDLLGGAGGPAPETLYTPVVT